VRALLPASPNSRVVMTSRRRLAGLDTVDVPVDVLTAPEAQALLRAIVGDDRVGDDEATASRVAEQCARLPLALRIAAERLKRSPDDTFSDLAEDLEVERLEVLALPGDVHLAVVPALSLSYQSLDPTSARVFRLLGVHTCGDIGEQAVAALTGLAPRVARAALVVLVEANVLERDDGGRYRFHDLLRAYAQHLADLVDPAAERVAAVGRLVRWYAAMCDHADHELAGRRARLHPDLRSGVPVSPFADHPQAMTWCDEELTNLASSLELALEHGMAALAWQVPAALQGYFNLSKNTSAWLRVHEVGLTAARSTGDVTGVALMHYGIASAHRFRKRDRQAVEHGLLAVEAFRELGDRRFQGIALSNLGLSLHYSGSKRAADECLGESLLCAREVGDAHAEAWTLTNLGSVHRRNGEHEKSLTVLLNARRLRSDIGDRDGEAWTLDELGRTYAELAVHDLAERSFRRAIALHGVHGNTYGRARALDHFGQALFRQDRFSDALEAWMEALPLYERLRDPRAFEMRLRIAETN
jgi:tetratricopeptide (TPR) repeat protein